MNCPRGCFSWLTYFGHDIPRRRSVYAAVHRPRQRHTGRGMAGRGEERDRVVEERTNDPF